MLARILCLAAWMLTLAQTSAAVTFRVDTETDSVDAAPGDGLCIALSGGCTLRAAVMESNAIAGADEIRLPSGLYLLTVPGAPDLDAAQGDLDLLEEVAIIGEGASTTAVVSQDAQAVFHVGAGPSELASMRIVGAIGASAALSIRDCVIENSVGNGISGYYGPFSFHRTIIRNNGGYGIEFQHTNFVLEECQVTNNSRGIWYRFGSGTIRSSLVAENTGTGIATESVGLVIEDSIIRDNDGGLFIYEGAAEIRRTLVRGCTDFGVSCWYTARCRISDSAVLGNQVGIAMNGYTDLTVSNTTISGNHGGEVGGISLLTPGPTRILNSTITGNSGSTAGGMALIRFFRYGDVEVSGSVVSGNYSGSAPSDCATGGTEPTPIVLAGGNVLGTSVGCDLVASATDQIGTPLAPIDALLGPLSAAVGPTPFHPLLPGSPAIDRGTSACDGTDQRGFPRPLDGDGDGNALCDAGAVEASWGDGDSDGIADVSDLCPLVPDEYQDDADADGVGDACDNCRLVANPRVQSGFLASNGWARLTGGQRDDDGDGYGNKCDAKFPGTSGPLVAATDLIQFRASNGKAVHADICGTAGSTPCAVFDLDEAGALIGATDLVRFRALNGKRAGPACPTCPRECAAGADATCD